MKNLIKYGCYTLLVVAVFAVIGTISNILQRIELTKNDAFLHGSLFVLGGIIIFEVIGHIETR